MKRRPPPPVPGVREAGVHAPEPLERRPPSRRRPTPRRRCRRSRASARVPSAASSATRTLVLVRARAPDRHIRARARERLREAEPDAAVAAGDERDMTAEIEGIRHRRGSLPRSPLAPRRPSRCGNDLRTGPPVRRMAAMRPDPRSALPLPVRAARARWEHRWRDEGRHRGVTLHRLLADGAERHGQAPMTFHSATRPARLTLSELHAEGRAGRVRAARGSAWRPATRSRSSFRTGPRPRSPTTRRRASGWCSSRSCRSTDRPRSPRSCAAPVPVRTSRPRPSAAARRRETCRGSATSPSSP